MFIGHVDVELIAVINTIITPQVLSCAHPTNPLITLCPQMTLNKMVVLFTATLFCTAAAVFHQPSYYPAVEPYNYTGEHY